MDRFPARQSAADAVAALRRRFQDLRDRLRATLVGKPELADLVLVAAVAKEPLLFVGPPGTGKSEIIRQLTAAVGIGDSEYFEYTLTSGTEVREILGDSADDDVGCKAATMSAAQIAYLRDVFACNSAVLNFLLNVIDKGQRWEGGAASPLRAPILFASASTLPEEGAHRALCDRFALKVESDVVHEEYFGELLRFGMRADYRMLSPESAAGDLKAGGDNTAANQCTYDDFRLAQQHVFRSFASATNGGHSTTASFDDELLSLFRRVIQRLIREDRIYVSDRKVIKLNKLIRTRAWLFGDGTVRADDLKLLAYIGDSVEEMTVVRQKVPVLLDQ